MIGFITSHLDNDFGGKLAGIVLSNVAIEVLVVQVQLEVQRVLHVVDASVGLVFGVHLTVEQPVGAYGGDHVVAAAVDFHAEARRHLVSGGPGGLRVRLFELR